MTTVLVLHGAAVWKAVVALLVAAGLGESYLRARLRARAAVRSQQAVRAASVTALAPGPVIVRGIYRAAGPALDHADGRIGLPANLPVEVSDRAERVPTIRDGVEVLVGGTLVPASTESPTYRDSGMRYTIASPDDASTWIAAVRPDALPPPRPLAAWFGRALMLAVGSMLMLALAGQLSSVDRQHLPYLDDPGAINRLVIGAALPGQRTDALADLDYVLENRATRTDAWLPARIDVWRAMGDCPAEHLVRIAEPERALEELDGCSPTAARRARARALLVLGRYEEIDVGALEQADPPMLAASVAVVRGDFQRAARRLDELAAQATGVGSPPPGERERVWIATLRCKAQILRGYAGEVVALDTVPDHELSYACLSHEHRDPDAWADHRDPNSALADPIRHALRMLEQGYGEIWLAPFVPETLPLREPALAAYAALLGDLPSAWKHVARSPTGRRPEQALAVAVALRDFSQEAVPLASPQVDWPLEHRRQIRRGEDIDVGAWGGPSAISVIPCRVTGAKAVRAAADGDGSLLARMLRECASESWQTTRSHDLPSLLVHIRRGASETASALRRARPSYDIHDVFSLVDEIVHYRDTARALGDTGEAARWQAMLERHAAALHDEARVRALILLAR